MVATRAFCDEIIVVASHNAGKLREISELLSNTGITVKLASDLGVSEPEETGTTFAANAILKAKNAVEATGLPALADDSGFAVEALDGMPGIYSARWAGPDRDFSMAMRNVAEKIVEGGADPSGARAAFISVLALMWPDGHFEIFEGRTDGTIAWPPRGNEGFGYDPMFVPDGHDRTFGEMSAEEKHGIGNGQGLSHRARAFQMLLAACF